MRIGDFTRLVAGVLGGTVLLAGCGGSQAANGALGAVPSIATASNAAANLVPADEFLSAESRHVDISEPFEGDYQSVSFAIRGKAGGAVPGTFTAKGSWTVDEIFQSRNWSFNESFTVTSARGKFAGTVRGEGTCNGVTPLPCGFGAPGALTYNFLNVVNGQATASIGRDPKHFREMLAGVTAIGRPPN